MAFGTGFQPWQGAVKQPDPNLQNQLAINAREQQQGVLGIAGSPNNISAPAPTSTPPPNSPANGQSGVAGVTYAPWATPSPTPAAPPPQPALPALPDFSGLSSQFSSAIQGLAAAPATVSSSAASSPAPVLQATPGAGYQPTAAPATTLPLTLGSGLRQDLGNRNYPTLNNPLQGLKNAY